MEEKEGINGSGVIVRGDEAPQSYIVEPGVANSGNFDGTAAVAAEDVKKKKGRPRKYAAHGSIVALSPMPISASIPLTGDYPGWKQSGCRPADSFKKKNKLDFGNAGSPTIPYPVGGSFTPHMITVNSGEDIMMKIISFSQQGSRAICILAANGIISNVTLRQPNSSGGTLTYEGCFEILSLTGSFIPSDNGLTKSRSGGMSVSVAGPDGCVLGGGLAGMLVAAGPVQIVIGSFLSGGENLPEQKQIKKLKYEQTISFGPTPTNPILEPPSYGGAKTNLPVSVSFSLDNLASLNSIHGGSNPVAMVSLPGADSREQSQELTTC